jgi:hypothetical protein
MTQTHEDILSTPLAENQSVMAVMIPYDDKHFEPGDYKITWDRTKTVEVDQARKQFDEWKAKGYCAYRVEGRNGEKGTVLKDFDPTAQTIIFALPLQGGK